MIAPAMPLQVPGSRSMAAPRSPNRVATKRFGSPSIGVNATESWFPWGTFTEKYVGTFLNERNTHGSPLVSCAIGGGDGDGGGLSDSGHRGGVFPK